MAARMELGLDDTLRFGKHRGREVGAVLDDDPQWLEWAVENANLELDRQTLDMLEREIRGPRR